MASRSPLAMDAIRLSSDGLRIAACGRPPAPVVMVFSMPAPLYVAGFHSWHRRSPRHRLAILRAGVLIGGTDGRPIPRFRSADRSATPAWLTRGRGGFSVRCSITAGHRGAGTQWQRIDGQCVVALAVTAGTG